MQISLEVSFFWSSLDSLKYLQTIINSRCSNCRVKREKSEEKSPARTPKALRRLEESASKRELIEPSTSRSLTQEERIRRK